MKKIALLFAGQGAQTVGMGRDLCARYPASQRLFTQANEILGRDLQSICFTGPESLLTQTDNAQPGIFVTSLACLAALQTELPSFEFLAAAGLSLGELTALTAAGGLSFGDGLRLVQARGRFMQEACEATVGGMASVIGLDDAVVKEICKVADVDVANLNCPGQVVISGERTKLEAAIQLCRERGAKRVIPLAVAGAYHSRLMKQAQQKFAAALDAVQLSLPRVPVVANVSARPAESAAEIRELLVQQITSSVRWTESMQWLIEQGFSRFIELGPGAVLSGLMRRINKDVEVLTVSDCATLEATVAKLRL